MLVEASLDLLGTLIKPGQDATNVEVRALWVLGCIEATTQDACTTTCQLVNTCQTRTRVWVACITVLLCLT